MSDNESCPVIPWIEALFTANNFFIAVSLLMRVSLAWFSTTEWPNTLPGSVSGASRTCFGALRPACPHTPVSINWKNLFLLSTENEMFCPISSNNKQDSVSCLTLTYLGNLESCSLLSDKSPQGNHFHRSLPPGVFPCDFSVFHDRMMQSSQTRHQIQTTGNLLEQYLTLCS